MENSLQIIISIAGVGIVLLLALMGSEWRLGSRLANVEARLEGRLDRLENQIGDLGAGIRSLNQQVASIVGLLPMAFTYLHRSHAITEEEYHDAVGQFTSQVGEGGELLIDHLARSMNPLTSQEGERFRELVGKARHGEWFTRSEVEEYNRLIKKRQTDHPDDPSIWPLVALGAFLSGLYVGQRQEDA